MDHGNFTAPKRSRRFVASLAFAFACSVAMFGACRDAMPPSRSNTVMQAIGDDSLASHARLSDAVEFSISAAIAAGKCTGTVGSSCTVTYTAIPADWQCFTNLPGHCTPSGGFTSKTGQLPNGSGDFPAPQWATVTLTMSRPVWGVVVRAGMGAVKCSGTLPTVAAYNGQNVLVSFDTVLLQFPDDCGSDDITGWTVDSVEYTGAVKKLVITTPSPGEWTHPSGIEAYAKVFHTQEFYELPPPTDTCLTGDPLLDTPRMRSLLRTLRDSSNWNDPVKTNRKERGGYLFQLPSGDLLEKTFFSAADEWCATPNIPTPPESGSVYLAGAHLHPFRGCSPLEATPTGVCANKNRPANRAYDPRPSNDDITRLRGDSTALGYPLHMYVVDKDSIYAVPPGTTVRNRRQKVVGYPIISPVNGCSLL